MVRNRHLAKSIHDAGWGTFLRWVRYYATLHDIPVIAVSPEFTSQDWSGCGTRVKKSLSVRTHICPGCGLVLDRDHNAALCLLQKAVALLDEEERDRTGGQAGTGQAPALRNAWGEMTATALPAMVTTQVISWNQEPPAL